MNSIETYGEKIPFFIIQKQKEALTYKINILKLRFRKLLDVNFLERDESELLKIQELIDLHEYLLSEC